MRSSLVLVLTAALAGGISAAEPQTCAVLPFEAKGGVTEQEADLLSDRLSAELTRHQKYRVVTRTRIEELLKLQQKSRSDFYSAEGAVELGQLLGAQVVVCGSVGRFGSLYTLNTELISVRSGEVLKIATTDGKGSKEDLLTKLVPRNVHSLVSGRSTPTVVPEEQTVDPEVDAPPPGLETAWKMYRAGLYDQAEALVLKYRKEAGSTADSHTLLGRVYARKKGWYKMAVREFEEALKLDPASTAARLGLARTHIEVGDRPDKGVPLLQQVLALEPRNEAAMTLLQSVRE